MHQPDPPTGDAIKEARLAELLSQADAAKRAGIDTSTLKRLESSRGEQCKPSLRGLAKLLSAFPTLRKEDPDVHVHAPAAPDHSPVR